MYNLKVVYSVDPCLVKLACFQPINLKSNLVIKCIKRLCPPLMQHNLLPIVTMSGVTHHITHHLLTKLTVHLRQETSIIPFLKTQLLEEINNSFTLRLQVILLEVLILHFSIQVLSIHQGINILHRQGLAISLKLRAKVYTLSIQVVTGKINQQEEIRIREDCHHCIMNQIQIRASLTITVLEITLVQVTALAVIPCNTPKATLIRAYMVVLEELNSRLEARIHQQN